MDGIGKMKLGWMMMALNISMQVVVLANNTFVPALPPPPDPSIHPSPLSHCYPNVDIKKPKLSQILWHPNVLYLQFIIIDCNMKCGAAKPGILYRICMTMCFMKNYRPHRPDAVYDFTLGCTSITCMFLYGINFLTSLFHHYA